MDENKSSTFSFLRSEAIFIAILTVGAYLIAFSFEAGYLSKFNVPLFIIRISIELILFIIVLISASLVVLYSLVNIIAMTLPKIPVLQEKVIRIIILLVFPIWNIIFYGFRKKDITFYSIILITIIILEVVWPILVYRDKKSIKDRFIADEVAELGARQRGLMGRLHMVLGSLITNLIYIIILGAVLAHSAGGAKAETQEEYYLCVDSNIAIIRIYSEILIGVSIDYNNQSIENKIVIQKISERQKTELILSKIGPLKLK